MDMIQTYNGGNKQPSEATAMTEDMQAYRQGIFTSPNGTIDGTCLSIFHYRWTGGIQLLLDVNNLETDAGAYGR